jgi:signal transduction histidine kinase
LEKFSIAAYAWTLDQLRAGRLVHIADIADLPTEARAEKEAALAIGLRSAVTCPLIRGGELVGVLGLSSLNSPRFWTDESLGIVRLVATMFLSVVDRQRTDSEIARRAQFERLMGRLAMDLVNLPDAKLDVGLSRALGELGEFTGFDRVYLFEFCADGTAVSCRHRWGESAVAEEGDAVPEISLHDLRWAAKRLESDEDVSVVHRDDVPSDAIAEQRLLERLGLETLVLVPMTGATGPLGYLVFATVGRKRSPSPEAAPMLRIAAQLFANAIERRRAERSALEHQAELAHVLRLGTMGELAPWLAHELNQPLSAIASFARGCERRLAAGDLDIDALIQAVVGVSQQAMRAADVVQSLRRHVRKHAPQRVWQRMDRLITSAMDLLRTEAQSLAIQTRLDLDPEPAWVQVDPIQIEQVVLNLIRNGFDAIELGSHGERVLTVSSRCTANSVEIDVEDSGIGIDESRADEMFDAFSSTKSDGLGLGLSVSRSIVEAHGGRIRAQRRTGGGSVFRFTIPRSLQPSDEAV